MAPGFDNIRHFNARAGGDPRRRAGNNGKGATSGRGGGGGGGGGRSARTDPWQPHDPEAEAAVLGAILIAPDALADVADFLKPDHFHLAAHATVYEAALTLYEQQTPADLITLCDELARQGKLEDVRGASYVSALANNVPNSGNIASYARIVHRRWVERSGMHLAADLSVAYHAGDLEAVATLRGKLAELDAQAQQGKAHRFQIRTVEEMLTRARPEAVVEGLYHLNTVGMKFGEFGSGKSLVQKDQMLHVAAGRPWEGHAVKAGWVVHVVAEGDAFERERLEAWLLTHPDFTREDIARYVIVDAAPQLLNPDEVEQFLHDILAQLPEPPVWIVFDTLSQTSGGGDQDKNSDMAAYVRAQQRIRDRTGAFVESIHHAGWEGGKPRGASSLPADIDTVSEVSVVDKERRIGRLRCYKQKGGGTPFPDWTFRIKSILLEPDGDPNLTGPIVEAYTAEDAAAASDEGGLSQSDWVLLETLANHPYHGAGLFSQQWQDASGLAQRTFYDSRKRLVERWKYVNGPIEKRYFVSPKGLEVLRSHCGRTAGAPGGTGEVTAADCGGSIDPAVPAVTATSSAPAAGPPPEPSEPTTARPPYLPESVAVSGTCPRCHTHHLAPRIDGQGKQCAKCYPAWVTMAPRGKEVR